MSDATAIPFIEQIKAQAQVLVPLIKAFEAELGTDRARAIARNALAGWMRDFYAQMRADIDNPIDLIAAGLPLFADQALEYDVVQQTPDAFDFNVKRCAYAEFYKTLDEPDLGFLFVCDLDRAMAEGIGDDVDFQRSQTIMQGADHCDFRYRRR